MKKSPLREKTFEFSKNIIELYKELRFKEKEYVISNQILKSGTSIGANYEEALSASSKKDYLAKLNISYKESYETYYWLRLIKSSYSIETEKLENDIKEIIKMLTSSIKTTKKKMGIVTSRI